ncbi:MAG TPA: HAD family hydrolase [Geothermobacteraceae bacterium]|nr:HAD family hydrolase [Geothermobacteraceae bacterium]
MKLPQQSIEAILFDLDGTLLQVEMQEFIPRYLQQLSVRFAPEVEPVRFQVTLRAAIFALLQARDGEQTNEELFLRTLERQLGIVPERYRRVCDQWLEAEVESLQPLVTRHPLATQLVEAAFARGAKVVIATNPVFPRRLIEARLRWAGLDRYPYSLVTCYENSRHCKPNPEYFQEVLEKVELAPEQCLMVGNDNHHDLAAIRAGIPTYLVETWLIDRGTASFEPDFRGVHAELLTFLNNLR